MQLSSQILISNVITSMDHWKEPLDLEIGDTIIWRGEGIQNEEGMVLFSPGMKGKVITRSEKSSSCLRGSEGGHHPGF